MQEDGSEVRGHAEGLSALRKNVPAANDQPSGAENFWAQFPSLGNLSAYFTPFVAWDDLKGYMRPVFRNARKSDDSQFYEPVCRRVCRRREALARTHSRRGCNPC